jgi:hypothetical protein
MESKDKDAAPGVFPGVDLRSFLEILRIQWWIVPVLLGVSVGLLQLQHVASRSQSADVVISRNYEISTPQNTLRALGVDLTITEFPSLQAQIGILNNDETRREIADEIGMEIEIRPPDEWSLPLNFECIDDNKDDCAVAIDAYVEKLVEIRREAIQTGIADLSRVLTSAQATKESVVVASQLLILDSLAKNVVIESAYINSTERAAQAPLQQVSGRNLATAATAGLLISFIILLQLTYSDKKVRSVKRLVQLVGEDAYIGRASANASAVDERRAAIGLRRSLVAAASTSVRFLQLRTQLANETVLAALAGAAGAQHRMAGPYTELGVPELVDPTKGESDVIVVQRNHDLRSDVLEAVNALRRSGRPLAGVLLVD